MALSKEQFRKRAIQNIRDAREHCQKWHRAARDDFAFVSGDQWLPTDKELLELQQRPVVTFNYSEKMIDAVGGAEVSNRQECVFKPRGIEDANLAELWTEAARAQRDECMAEDEETDAFRDALICGMGWVETKMDYTEDPDGMIVLSRNDPMEMFWDPAAIKPGLSDRRYDIQGVWMDNDLVKMRWPKADAFGSGDDGDSDSGSFGIIQTGNRYNGNNNDDDAEDDKRVDQTRVWNYQCMEMEPYYRVSAGDGHIESLSTTDFNKMADQIKAHGLKYAKLWKKVYYRGFMIDETILEWGPSPCQVGFTRKCITGKRDRNKNLWYGLTRVMKDPQRWANKWLAQIMQIINANAKGGIMAETGAFVDPRKAQDEWSSPDSVTLLNEGGIAKVKEKQMTQYPAGLSQMMEFALNSLPQVTGINLEALGLANRDQANVLEQSRKQAAYGLLAPVFDSLHRYRKEQGKVMLFFMRTFISDNRMVRIVGPGMEQYIPLTKVPDAQKFDIIVDQAPTAPDVKQRTWDTLMQIVPPMIKAGLPMPPDLLTYAPLPSGLIMKWQQFIQQKQQQQQVSPEQMQQMQQQLQDLQQQLVQEKQNNQAAVIDAQTKQQEAQSKIELHTMEAQAKIELAQQKQDFELGMQQQNQDHQMQLATHSSQGNLKIKAASAGLGPDAQKAITIRSDNTDVGEAMSKVAAEFSNAMKEIVSLMQEPKVVVRDAAGRITGVKPVAKL